MYWKIKQNQQRVSLLVSQYIPTVSVALSLSQAPKISTELWSIVVIVANTWTSVLMTWHALAQKAFFLLRIIAKGYRVYTMKTFF